VRAVLVVVQAKMVELRLQLRDGLLGLGGDLQRFRAPQRGETVANTRALTSVARTDLACASVTW
jgi:hypothetical protein